MLNISGSKWLPCGTTEIRAVYFYKLFVKIRDMTNKKEMDIIFITSDRKLSDW